VGVTLVCDDGAGVAVDVVTVGTVVGAVVGAMVGFVVGFVDGGAVGVGLALDAPTFTIPFVIVAVMLVPPLASELLSVVPSRDIKEVPVAKTLKLIVAKTPFPFTPVVASKISATP